MQELLAQPWARYVLIGIGMLYFISKYLPIRSLFNSVGNKSRFNYAFVPEIIALVKSYNNKDFKAVESSLDLSLNDSYKDFGINALSEVSDNSIIEEWLQQSPDNQLALTIKGAKLIVDAWEVRGNRTIDQVNPDNLVTFKKMLEESKAILLKARQETGKYSVYVNSMLLKLYKALDVDRAEIHNTFKIASEKDLDNIVLNINYYACLSEKWGGTKEEMETYYNSISKNEILQNILRTMSYNDQIYFEVPSYSKEDKKVWKQKVKNFIKNVDSTPLDESNLHKYELYRSLAMLAADVGGLDDLVTKLEQKSSFYYKW